jgi:hypothetical protein
MNCPDRSFTLDKLSRQVENSTVKGFKMMLRNDEPYAVIALDEHNFGPHTRYEMSISLTLAFLLSARLPFHFPMSDDVSRDVDRAFDKVLKDLPMESKGIAYMKDLGRDGKIRLLDGAKLVITSDPQIQERMDAESSPNIFLDFKSGRSPFIRWRFLENLDDDILKHQIIVYSKLINTALEKIENTRRVASVVVGGKLLPRKH